MKGRIEQSDKEGIISEIRGMFYTLEQSIDQLAEATAKGFSHVHDRIDSVDNKIEHIDSRVESFDNKIQRLDEKVDELRNDMNMNFAMKIANDLA